jgi:Zn-dependent protease with chaperone function
MSAAVFPVLGAVLVFLGVLPLTALLARLVLRVADHVLPASWQHFHGELRYFLIVMASAAPLLWFVSAGVHQAESGEPSGVCASEHGAEGIICWEPWLFALILSVYCASLALRRRVSKQSVGGGRARELSARGQAAALRVARLLTAHAGLHALRRRCQVSDELPFSAATVGMLFPRVVLSIRFVELVDDDELVGTLHHELEHVRGHDPLRYFLAALSLRVNAWGRVFLDRELWQWRFQRELHCDREAVANGASATAIARAIVIAARNSLDSAIVALGDADGRALRLRVELLLAYAERPPQSAGRRARSAFGATLFAALALALLPHGGRTWALDTIHTAVETTVLALAS